MKPIHSLTACVFALSLFGCQSNKPPPDTDLKPKGPIRTSDRQYNSAMVHDYYNQVVNAAVIREQMMYPYHFVINGTAFTELGQRDMDLLARHYVENPGNLGVRRGDESKELYDARVQVVLDALKVAGVRMDRVKVSDGMPGGDGVTSDRVVLIQTKWDAQTGTSSESSNGSEGSMSGSGGSGSSSGSGYGSGSGSGSGGL